MNHFSHRPDRASNREQFTFHRVNTSNRFGRRGLECLVFQVFQQFGIVLQYGKALVDHGVEQRVDQEADIVFA